MTILLLLFMSVLMAACAVLVILLVYMHRNGVHAITFTVERPQKRQEAQR